MSSEYVNSYIAFLDILGFKELVRTHTCEEILKVFDEIKSTVYKGLHRVGI